MLTHRLAFTAMCEASLFLLAWTIWGCANKPIVSSTAPLAQDEMPVPKLVPDIKEQPWVEIRSVSPYISTFYSRRSFRPKSCRPWSTAKISIVSSVTRYTIR